MARFKRTVKPHCEKTLQLVLSSDDVLLLLTLLAFDWCSASCSDRFSFRYTSWQLMLYLGALT